MEEKPKISTADVENFLDDLSTEESMKDLAHKIIPLILEGGPPNVSSMKITVQFEVEGREDEMVAIWNVKRNS